MKINLFFLPKVLLFFSCKDGELDSKDNDISNPIVSIDSTYEVVLQDEAIR